MRSSPCRNRSLPNTNVLRLLGPEILAAYVLQRKQHAAHLTKEETQPLLRKCCRTALSSTRRLVWLQASTRRCEPAAAGLEHEISCSSLPSANAVCAGEAVMATSWLRKRSRCVSVFGGDGLNGELAEGATYNVPGTLHTGSLHWLVSWSSPSQKPEKISPCTEWGKARSRPSATACGGLTPAGPRHAGPLSAAMCQLQLGG